MAPPPPAGHAARIAVGTPPLPAAASTAKTLAEAHAQRSWELPMKSEIAPPAPSRRILAPLPRRPASPAHRAQDGYKIPSLNEGHVPRFRAKSRDDFTSGFEGRPGRRDGPPPTGHC